MTNPGGRLDRVARTINHCRAVETSYSFYFKINVILELSTQTNIKCKNIKILFIFCENILEIILFFMVDRS